MQFQDVRALGELLQKCRKMAGLTQDQLAMRLHRTQSCVSKYEKGEKIPDVFTFINWLNATNAHQAAIVFLYGIDAMSIIQHILPSLIASTFSILAA
jgi:transcriptional regulator with XRE-family HTH domain